MDQIDAKVFALITGATLFVVGALKMLFPKKISGKEAGIALLLPPLFTIVAKLLGGFQVTPWVDALLWAIGSGAASGVAHDKILNPVKKTVKGILPKPPQAK